MVEKIKAELEKETAVLNDAEQKIAQLRQMLDQQTAVLLETAGKIKAYRKLLREAESGAQGEDSVDAVDGD